MDAQVVFKWASPPLDNQTASCNSSHDKLINWSMDLAALCNMWR